MKFTHEITAALRGAAFLYFAKGETYEVKEITYEDLEGLVFEKVSEITKPKEENENGE